MRSLTHVMCVTQVSLVMMCWRNISALTGKGVSRSHVEYARKLSLGRGLCCDINVFTMEGDARGVTTMFEILWDERLLVPVCC